MPPQNIAESNQPFVLLIGDDDVDSSVQARLKVIKNDTTVLDKESDFKKVLFDAIPTVISKRLKQIVPPDFVLTEIELKFAVDGKIGGSGISGEVKAKLRPKDA